MQIGLTHDEYQQISHLQFPTGGEQPKNTNAAAGELRQRGYAATTDKLKKLVRGGVLPPAESNRRDRAWTPERIDQAANHFESVGDFTPEAAFCNAWELSYGEWWKQLRKAYRQAVTQYGQVAKQEIGYEPDPIHFELHVQQARTENQRAKVWWTLREDVRNAIAKRVRSI